MGIKKCKKYEHFSEFYQDSYNLTEYVKNSARNLSDSDKINFARQFYSEIVLNSYIIVGKISKEIQEILNSDSDELKFSIDNMVKNCIAHPEVCYDDYEKIPFIIKNPSKYYKSKTGYDIILFKADTKYYKLVIKTTKNRKENFVKSLHLLNAERYYKY